MSNHVVIISFPKSRVSKDKLDFVKMSLDKRQRVENSLDKKGRVALSRVSIFTHVDPTDLMCAVLVALGMC